jgi:hypothetical protein
VEVKEVREGGREGHIMADLFPLSPSPLTYTHHIAPKWDHHLKRGKRKFINVPVCSSHYAECGYCGNVFQRIHLLGLDRA